MVRFTLWLALAALLAGPAPAQFFGQFEPESEEVPAGPPASLTGKVLDKLTGAPVQGATVVLSSSGRRGGSTFSATTDAGGVFQMADVQAGRYRLTAEKNRYALTTYGEKISGDGGEALEIGPGERRGSIELKLTPAGVVTGRVIDQNGEPMAYANIAVMKYRYNQGEKELRPVSRPATTNDLGEYRLFGLQPGRYYVSASYSGQRMPRFGPRGFGGRSSNDVVYPTQYYPGVLSANEAMSIELSPGEEASGVDFRLSPASAVTVSGTVTRDDGEALDRRTRLMLIARVEERGFDGAQSRGTGVDRNGSFTIQGVLPGEYDLAGFAGGRDDRQTGRVRVSVGADNVDDVRLVLSGGVTISGAVVLPEEGGEAVDLNEFSVDMREVGGFQGDRARLEDDGTFVMDGMAIGPHRLTMSGLPTNGYVRAIRVGSRTLPDALVDVPRDGLPDLTVEIALDGASISGRALDSDEQGLAKATVVLVPEELHRPELYKRVAADESGTFTITGVAPGKYNLYAFDRLERGAEMDPEFMRRYTSTAVDIELEPSDNKAEDLEVSFVPVS